MTRFGALNNLSGVEDTSFSEQFSTKLVSTEPENLQIKFADHPMQENTVTKD